MSNKLHRVTKAVCYIRKSREDEEAEMRGENTLAKQREMLKRDVLPRYTFACDLIEEVASGDSIRHRPMFQSILSKLGTEYQAIVCKDLSRLGRGSYSDMGIVYDIIRDRRIIIITTDAVYDPANFSDLRMIRFSLFFNREEYEMTLWRLTEGKYDGARKGKWVAGVTPFGFRYDSKKQVLIENPEEAPVVRLIFDLYVNRGLGFQGIATELRKMGYRSPRGREEWRPEVIHRILQNPAYQGTLVFRKTQRNKLDGRVVKRPKSEHIVVEDAFDGLIPKTVWHQAQTRLLGARIRPKVKVGHTTYELAGLIQCYRCQKNMVRQSSTKKYQKRDGHTSEYAQEFLYCSTCRYSVQYRVCEAQIVTVLSQLENFDSHLIEERMKAATGCYEGGVSADMAKVREQLDGRRLAILNRLGRAKEMLLDGVFDKGEYAEVKNKCERDLAHIERALLPSKSLACDDKQVENDTRDRRNNANAALLIYQQLADPSLKNELLRNLIRGITVELLEKGKKNRPTRFNLHITLQSSRLLSTEGGELDGTLSPEKR